MTSKEFFIRINQQLENSLPFVIYRKPNETKISGLLQHTTEGYKLDFMQSGFVFAPFDLNNTGFMIPSNGSESIYTTVDNKVGQFQAEDDDDQVLYLDNTIEDYLQLLEKAISEINTTILEKVVISRDEEIDLKSTSAIVVFKRLIYSYPSAFSYYWFHPETGGWLGATPEALFSIKDTLLSTMSLAGTQAFDGSLNVKWELKEINEQQIVTDFIIKQLESIIDDLIVKKTETIKAGELLHLRSLIEGRLKPEIDSVESIIRALHPSPAICGMPKKEAGNFIYENENYDRSFYAGFLGELNDGFHKSTDLFINLRCMHLHDGLARLFAGGGITKDSDPMKEWEETVEKMKTMRRVIAF